MPSKTVRGLTPISSCGDCPRARLDCALNLSEGADYGGPQRWPLDRGGLHLERLQAIRQRVRKRASLAENIWHDQVAGNPDHQHDRTVDDQ